MDDYRKSLRPVGIALILVGLLDLAQMVYTMVTRGGFQSSFGILALIPGISVYRGSLRAAWWVVFFSALGLGMLAGIAVLLSLIVPVGLIWPGLKTYPLLVTEHLLVVIAVVALGVWIYRRVTTPAVLDAADREPDDRRSLRVRPVYGLIAGVVLAAVMVVGLGSFLHSDAARRAEIEAQRKMGPGYDYFIYQVFWEYPGGKKITGAKVIAYNPREVREMEVRWEK